MRVLIIFFSLVLIGCGDTTPFSPDSAHYELSSCYQMGAPEEITLTAGKFSYGKLHANGEHELEIAINKRFYGTISGTNQPFTLVELSCQQWGANYTDYEWFIFSADGEHLAKLDENDFINSYAKLTSDPMIWFSNQIPQDLGEMISVEGAKIQFRFAADGSHAAPDTIVTFHYQMTSNGLQETSLPQRDDYR